MRHPIFFSIIIGFLSFFAIAPARAQWVQTALNKEVSCFAVSGTTLLAGTEDGIYHTTDNGASWSSASFGIPPNFSVVSIFVSGANMYAAAYGSGAYLSTNNGTSWNPINHGIGTDSTYIDCIATNGMNLIAGTEGYGVFLSTNNGASWNPANSGLSDGYEVYSLTISGNNIIAGTSGYIFLSTNSGTSWIAESASPSDVHSFAVNGANVVAGCYNGSGAFYSSDNGMNWTSPSGELSGRSALSVAIIGDDLFAGTGTCVYLSTSDGTTWTAVNNGMPTNAYYIAACAVSGTNLFAGTEYDGVWRCPISTLLYPPADTLAAPLLKDTSLTVSGDSASTRAHRIVFVNTSGSTLTILSAALTTSDNRFSISQLFPGVPDTLLPRDTFSIIVDFTGDDTGGVYPDTIVLAIDPNEEVSSNYIYLTGNSYSSARGGVVQNLHTTFEYLHIYPNPFSQSTQITFTSQAAGYADVSVVNILGAPVAHLFSGELDEGDHDFAWDAQGMAPGSYWCIVRMGDNVERIALSVER